MDIIKNKINPKKNCIYLGATYTLFGVFSLIIINIQDKLLSNSEVNSNFSYIKDNLIDIWNTFFPLLIILGLLYIIFGLLYYKIKVSKFILNLVLGILSFIWVVIYSIELINLSDLLMDEIEITKNLIAGLIIFGIIILIALFTIPQFMIGKNITKVEKLQVLSSIEAAQNKK